MTSRPEPPASALQLEDAVSRARRALDGLPDAGQRARREAAVDQFAAYVALLRQAVPPQAPSPSERAPSTTAPITLKLEYADGRWDIEEAVLGTPPRVGECIDLAERGRWRVEGTRVVMAAVRRNVAREFFVCTYAGDVAPV